MIDSIHCAFTVSQIKKEAIRDIRWRALLMEEAVILLMCPYLILLSLIVRRNGLNACKIDNVEGL